MLKKFKKKNLFKFILVPAIIISIIIVASVLINGVSASDNNLLKNGTFDNNVGSPWSFYSASSSNKVAFNNNECGVYVASPGTNKWDIQLRVQGLTIEKGHTYNVKFKVKPTADCKIYAKVGQAGSPYTEWWNNSWKPIELKANETTTVDQTFVMTGETDSGSELTFHMGGELAGSGSYTVYFDDVYLNDDQYIQEVDTNTMAAPKIRVNQVGYLPNESKSATLVSSATSPVEWSLKNSDGNTVCTGQTKVYGKDQASGDDVHIIDFSEYKQTGDDFTLVVGSDASHPFSIKSDIFSEVKYDALAYFYHNRSGIAIEMPYCGDSSYARPAGHLPDKWPTANGNWNYTLDVTGGWYDAGDHGKYVVNGGISAWQLMNQYEYSLYNSEAQKDSLGDGKLNIPENNNQIPDILDEARWEVDFMLKMQVPDGQPKAGMVHHKINDDSWTAIPTAPDKDTQSRKIYWPTTAATLNLAASSAQAARLFSPYDQSFSDTCLVAAEKAWDAAVANPSILFSSYSGGSGGGGDYGDNDVSDEFYWAASELYITTGKTEYLDYLKASEHYLKMNKDDIMAFDWANTASCGTLSLSLVPNNLSASDIVNAKKSIQSTADTYLDIIKGEGYLVPTRPNGYVWGSNSVVLNKAIVMAYAYDFTQNKDYITGVINSLDYIFGRNAMDKSYVTGYGERPLKNPHHRFWAYSANSKYPKPFPGTVSGGPNPNEFDPTGESAGLKNCAPQKSYVDDINAWACNEITINWNAPFAWLMSYVDNYANETES